MQRHGRGWIAAAEAAGGGAAAEPRLDATAGPRRMRRQPRIETDGGGEWRRTRIPVTVFFGHLPDGGATHHRRPSGPRAGGAADGASVLLDAVLGAERRVRAGADLGGLDRTVVERLGQVGLEGDRERL